VVGELRHLHFGFAPFPAFDVEGIAFGDGALWLSVGTTAPAGTPDTQRAEIYKVLPGPDGKFTGSGHQQDNVVTHWDTAGLGQPVPEGVAFDPVTGHLFIVSNVLHSDITEATTDGELVRIIDGESLGIRSPSSLEFAPASRISGGTGTHLYIADRGVDNNFNPDENDGKIYEVALHERAAAPTGLTAVSATDGIQLDWNDSQDPLFAGDNLYRSPTQIDGYAMVNSGLLTASDFIDTDAPTGTNLFYLVTTVDTFGTESLGSEPVGVYRSSIRLRGTSAADNGNKGGTSLTIRRPPGTGPGDLLVAVVDAVGTGAITPPTQGPWELVREEQTNKTLRQAVYYHVVADGDGTVFVFTLDSKRAATGAIAAYSGVDPTKTLSSGRSNASSKKISAPSVSTTPTVEAVVIGVFGTTASGGIRPPTGMFERAEAVSAGKAKVETELSDQVMLDFSATGPRKARAKKAAPNIGQLLVLMP